MDREFIKEIINLLKGSNIKVISIESEGEKIYIETYCKEGENTVENQDTKREEATHQEIIPPSEDVKEEHLHIIKSPLVGTFYRAPSPGAPPFVEVGDIVSPGQILCIIEALKVMNEIECDVRGKVEKILVENGERVEYGQPLFIINTKI